MKKKMWGASKKENGYYARDREKVFHEKYLVFAMKMHFPNGFVSQTFRV